MLIFLRGLVIGFALAAPVGPVGVLCIRRALADGRGAAFVAGMGAAVADTLYGAVAGLGLTWISQLLVAQDLPLRVLGGTVLVAIGLHTARTVPALGPCPRSGVGLVRDFASTFLITLTNPATIMAFMGTFAAMGTAGIVTESGEAAILILGVFGGSTLWWAVLSGLAASARSRMRENWLGRLNRGAGAVLILCGLALLASLAAR